LARSRIENVNRESRRAFSEHFRPIERLLGAKDIEGNEAFLEATGLGKKWLLRLIDGGIITSKANGDTISYSNLDITLGKLIVTMDSLGFGPKDGSDPGNLKKTFEFITKSLLKDTHALATEKT